MTPKVATAPDTTLAARDKEARAALATAQADRDKLALHEQALANAPALLAVLEQALVGATVEGNGAEQQRVRGEIERVKELLRVGPGVKEALATRARESGLAWSRAWCAYRDALAAEMLEPLTVRRQQLEADEIATRAAFERTLGEAPTL